MRFDPLEAVREMDRVDHGTVSEQRVRLPPVADDVSGLVVRRIVIQLDSPTRHGDDTIYLLPVENGARRPGRCLYLDPTVPEPLDDLFAFDYPMTL